MEDENDPPLDPKAVTTQRRFSQYDLEDHKACTVYIGYYVPGYRRKSHRRRHHHHHHHKSFHGSDASGHDISKPGTPPSERVYFILGDEEDGSHQPHPLFSEMEELFYENKNLEWRETARWIKFEEDVEEGGNRWSKPHVATVSLHSLFELRSCILNGSILLDVEAKSLDEIIELMLDDMESSNTIVFDVREKIKQVLLRPHRHQHELSSERPDKGTRIPLIRSFTEVGRNSSKISTHHVLSFWGSFSPHMPPVAEEEPSGNSASAGLISESMATNSSSEPVFGMQKNSSLADEAMVSDAVLHWNNQSFMKKIPPQAEASNILVGEVEYLSKVVSCFVRLNESCILGDLTEVAVPTRFIFILLGPCGSAVKYHEIGRAMATLLSDEVFHGVAYKAKTSSDLLAGVDEFLDATTVLPPGVWDPATRIEPPQQVSSQKSRKKPDPKKDDKGALACEVDYWKEFDLNYKHRFFGGLIADIRQKSKWYLSDFKDVFALQCISSIVFLYFVCIAQIITFGDLLAHVTNNHIASSECLLSALICGVIYSLFSGQPLTLLNSTGPMLVFEGIIFDACQKLSFDYLSIRVWVGLWTALFLFIVVAMNVPHMVRYITRFTEEIFATLICVFFIYKAFMNLIQIAKDFPLKTGFHPSPVPFCFCETPYPTNVSITSLSQCQSLHGVSLPVGCSYTPPHYVPDIFLMSLILFIGTFTVILVLRELKNTRFFPLQIRYGIASFSVLEAVIFMTLLDYYIGLRTPKLQVPNTFQPTLSDRNWVVSISGQNPWWSAVFAVLPAMLLTVSVLMDQQITAVIVNRKENKLKKGFGYHLDLFVLSFLFIICSIFGLPWFVAATVLSITHVNSLKYASKCSTPGDIPCFLGVREQRLTHFTVYLLIGLSFFFTDVLQYIPMPVLYGVFLFMGVTSLKGLQFFERFMLLFMPEKYQPDYSYLRKVPTHYFRLYTFIQLLLLGLLFCCKLFKMTAVVFPFLLVGIIFIRKSLGFWFKPSDLNMLDDDMPETTQFKKKKSAENSPTMSEVVCLEGEASKATVSTQDSSSASNISELLAQSSIWKSINQQSAAKATKRFLVSKTKKKKRDKSSKSEELRRLSVMEEEDEDNPLSSPSQPPSVPSNSVSPDSTSASNV